MNKIGVNLFINSSTKLVSNQVMFVKILKFGQKPNFSIDVYTQNICSELDHIILRVQRKSAEEFIS